MPLGMVVGMAEHGANPLRIMQGHRRQAAQPLDCGSPLPLSQGSLLPCASPRLAQQQGCRLSAAERCEGHPGPHTPAGWLGKAAAGWLGKAAAGCRSPCADETMKPTSESLSAQEARNLSVAEGYCVSARAGGEQSEAKDQSQTKVNLIRPEQLASSRTGGICEGKPSGVPCEARGASHAIRRDTTRLMQTDGGAGGVWI